MKIVQQSGMENVGPLNAGMVVADEIIRQRRNCKLRDRIKGDGAAGRVEAVVVVDESKVISGGGLPVQLGKQGDIIPAPRKLALSGMNRKQRVGDLLLVGRIVGFTRQGAVLKLLGNGNGPFGAGSGVPGPILRKYVLSTRAKSELITEMGFFCRCCS